MVLWQVPQTKWVTIHMSASLSAHKAAADKYRKALDAYVSVTTTMDVIQRVVEAAHSGDTAALSNWAPILDSKKDSLKDVGLLLKEYYTSAYSEQFEPRRSVSESFKKSARKLALK